MKKRNLWRVALVAGIVVAGFGLQASADADEVVERSIYEFVGAQQVFPKKTDVPLEHYYIGWTSELDESPILLAFVDYAGVANEALRAEKKEEINLYTQFSGKVTERRLADGRGEVVVTLRTTNALTFVTDATNPEYDPADPDSDEPSFIFHCVDDDCPLLFGARPEDILDGATPVLGESILDIKFISPEFGAPLPNIFSTFATGETFDEENPHELISISFHADASSLLPDGGSEKVIVDQIGRIVPGLLQLEKVFPIERIEIK